MLLALLSVGILFPVGRAEENNAPYVLARTFVEPSPLNQNYFGTSVAALGDRVLVGAPNSGIEAKGAAYLFDTVTGQLIRTFVKPSAKPGDFFGAAVALVGNRVLVGAPLDDLGAEEAGAAYLFDAPTGNLLQTFRKPSPAPFDIFGSSVAFFNNDVLVGAPWDSTGAHQAGAAYLFDAVTGRLTQTFLNPTPTQTDDFGFSVGALGDNVIVGTPGDRDGPGGVGTVYLFDALTGRLVRALHNPSRFGNLGSSVAGFGNNVLAGAPAIGVVYLFNGSTGDLVRAFLDPTPQIVGEDFGSSVATLGDRVLIGAPSAYIGLHQPGKTYLFDLSTGQLVQTFRDPSDTGYAQFGGAVAFVDTRIVVAAPSDNVAGLVGAGAVYLFTRH
jgi:outer membrane protein assembly factor BamB